MGQVSRYVLQFEQWIDEFINRYGLFSKDDQLLILVSGGADSLALLHCLLNLNYKVKALYFHHGTRINNSFQSDEHQIEIECIKKVLDQRAELVVEYLKGLSLADSNFENKARAQRLNILKEKYRDYLWITGHHLDDSFEWWLRGRMTQNHPDYPLGIPVINGRYRRAFLCVSKSQIERFALESKISFHQDSSNTNEKFERNFLRQQVIHSIRSRYPKYLRHYVQQSLLRAKRLGVLRKNPNKLIAPKKLLPKELVLAKDLWLLKCDPSQNQDQIFQSLLNFLKTHSSEKRGYFVKSLTHFFPDEINLLSSLKGPMSFSGGLHLWQWRNCFFLWHSAIRPSKELVSLDEYLGQNVSDIHFSLEKPVFLLEEMGLGLKTKSKNPRSLKEEVRFFKLICPVFYQELQARGLFVSHL